MSRRHGAAALLLVAVLVTACTSSTTRQTATSNAPISKSVTAVAARVGTPVTLHGSGGQLVTVTLDQVLTVAHRTAGEQPASGHRYFAVKLTVRNAGTAPIDEGPWVSAQVVDSREQQYDTAAVTGITAGPELPGEIKTTSGQARAGWLVFEVPAAARITTLQYGAAGGLGDQGQWAV